MRKKKYGYDVRDPFDKDMATDLDFSQLNKAGRKAKRKKLRGVEPTTERML